MIEEYGCLVRDIKGEITDVSLTVEQIIVLNLLNELGSSLSTYRTILNEQALREEDFPGRTDCSKTWKTESPMRQKPHIYR